MRGIVSEKLNDFLMQVNIAANEARKNNVQYTPELVRSNLNKLSAFIEAGPELAFVQDSYLSNGQQQIPVRIYSPSKTQQLPVLLHFHGGGHMCGSVDLYDPISRKIAKQANCIVICVEYRLAPEHPYPNGINDCEYILTHYKELLKELVHSDLLFTLGDSAGGAICTTLAQRMLTSPAIHIDKQVLIYPSVDYSMRLPSIAENGRGFLLEEPRITWYFNNYFQHNESKIDASPLYNIHNKIPETLILTAGCDPLRDEGFAYVKALTNHSVKVEHHHFEGMIHAYMLLESMVKSECEQSYQLIADFLK